MGFEVDNKKHKELWDKEPQYENISSQMQEKQIQTVKREIQQKIVKTDRKERGKRQQRIFFSLP